MMQTHEQAANRAPKCGTDGRKLLASRGRWVFGGFAAIALFMLAVEHRAHLLGWLGWLPWLFLIACPLMHVFMHGGYGHGGHDGTGGGDKK